jgi:hypothetical protein
MVPIHMVFSVGTLLSVVVLVHVRAVLLICAQRDVLVSCNMQLEYPM